MHAQDTAWMARLDEANREIINGLEAEARREDESREISASLDREAAYWKRVGGHDPVVAARADPSGLYS